MWLLCIVRTDSSAYRIRTKCSFLSKQEMDNYILQDLKTNLIEQSTNSNCTYEGKPISLDELLQLLSARQSFEYTAYGDLHYEYLFNDIYNQISYREEDSFTNKEMIYVYKEIGIEPAKDPFLLQDIPQKDSACLLQIHSCINHYYGGYPRHCAEITIFNSDSDRLHWVKNQIQRIANSYIDP